MSAATMGRALTPSRMSVSYAVVLAVVGVAIAATQIGPTAGTLTGQPYFWLMTAFGVVAALKSFVYPAPGDRGVVVEPTVCFSFAILLCWGLGPALFARGAAAAVMAWRHRESKREVMLSFGHQVMAFAAAAAVLGVTEPDPFGKRGPTNLPADVVAVIAAAVAWLIVYFVLRLVASHVRQTSVSTRRTTGLAADELLFLAALLLLSPVLAVGAHVNVGFVPLVFAPLYAVQRMARLSVERHRASLLDPLTALPNRAGLREQYEALSRDGRSSPGSGSDHSIALVALDLDRFKHVNDALGHHVGDEFLSAVAGRLDTGMPPGAMAARLGGDEFAVLAKVRSPEEARRIADDIASSVSEPVTFDGLSIDVTASVGVAVEQDRDDDFAALLRHADMAMYVAKRRGDSVATYRPEDGYDIRRRLSLLADFRQALEDDDPDQIQLHYQPQVSLRTGRPEAVEALLRWSHPVHGPVSTQEILQVAEQSSVMELLTARVIERVVAQVIEWAAHDLGPRVSLNISARDLYGGDIVSHLAAQLAEHGVPAEQIQLEITESAVLADPARCLATTQRLADLGVTLALDDYGTGFSSLQHLRRLPLSELKIDRTFVADMVDNTADAAIVASTVDMAESLGLRTVAEGVEDRATCAMLATIGCTAAQGWAISRPMPGDQITEWLLRAASPPAGTVPALPAPSAPGQEPSVRLSDYGRL